LSSLDQSLHRSPTGRLGCRRAGLRSSVSSPLWGSGGSASDRRKSVSLGRGPRRRSRLDRPNLIPTYLLIQEVDMTLTAPPPASIQPAMTSLRRTAIAAGVLLSDQLRIPSDALPAHTGADRPELHSRARPGQADPCRRLVRGDRGPRRRRHRCCAIPGGQAAARGSRARVRRLADPGWGRHHRWRCQLAVGGDITPGRCRGSALVTGEALVSSYNWFFLLGQSLMPALNARLLGSLLYRSRLVPRILLSWA
jgi:hypothetical protein